MVKQSTPILAFLGGFLGAGKTTLILRAAAILEKRGMRVAVITNDQDSGSVDSRFADAEGMRTEEIAGGCFCCRFSDLLDATDRLRAYEPDVIFAEPVGSCVDLSATILQPLKAHYQDAYRLAPLTVLIDPALMARAPRSELDAEREYLFRQQMAEADVLCMTKQDLSIQGNEAPFPVDFYLSAKTGEGVEAWLEEVLSMRRVAGARLLEVEYDRYGRAEAALGWLNIHADVQLAEASSPAEFAGPIFDELERRFTHQGIIIAHLKIFDRTSTGYVKASICANGDEPIPEGDLTAEPEQQHELAINVRALAEPEDLRRIVSDVLQLVRGSVAVRHLRAFRPPAPVPEHRFAHVVHDVRERAISGVSSAGN